ncbi:peptide ABC transporter substrate-binding protein [Acidimicrobiaceae bacterium USS-CC1]|uniref:Peptide ABC transporter substrate-binding protein n=1 Tax=Acidiferrimicrobium australe TaxID=2664430 RepID=A0ABW9QP95_9ACTN|nr:peptide ABC transporter substrate-binding protein [Acidiferrimicrobium australe]
MNTETSHLTRRQFLGALGAGAAAVAGGGLLAACGSTASSAPGSGTSPTSALAGTPKRGGTLQVGLSGGSSSDTLNALNPLQSTDFARTLSLFEQLTIYGPTGALQYLLAEQITPNATATQWTIHLRPGVTWHDGKDLTADDVIYTFQRITDPKSPTGGAPLLQRVDVAGMKKLDAHTVLVPCHAPYSTFPEAIAGWYFNIVPQGYDPSHPPAHPVGTGPFKFKSFTPGVQSVFVRNENYWQSPYPYLDTLVLSDYGDESSQVNALLSGSVDVIDLLSAASIATIANGGKKTLISNTSGFTPLYMRCDQPPFDDVRVRQAMRLCCDRPEMLKLVFAGHGSLGNDIYDYADPAYDHSIPQRHQDIEQAKYLLKQAGKENLEVTLTTAPIAQGTVQQATVFAQQAGLAGAKIHLDLTTPAVEFGPQYAKFTFAQDYVIYATYLTQIALSGLPTSPFPETHFSEPAYTALYNQALATVDQGKRYEIEHEMQRIDWERGGNIIPYFYPTIDGYAGHVNGLHTSVTGWPLGGFDFKAMWVS